MSQDELASLAREDEEIARELEALKRKRERIAEKRRVIEEYEKEKEREREKRRALKAEVTLRVLMVSAGGLVVEGPKRWDVLEIMQSTPGRAFRGYTGDGNGKNMVPIKEWDRCQERLLSRPNVTITFESGVKDELEWILTAPPWAVSLHPNGREILAKPGPGQSGYGVLSHVPGAKDDAGSKSWSMPTSEGWRLYEALSKTEGVVYTEDARKLIYEQVESRARLDQIAKQEDSEHEIFSYPCFDRPVTVRGVTRPWREQLKPFQRVSIEFMYVSGARDILGDDTGLGKTWQMLALAEVLRHEAHQAHPDEPFQTALIVKAANIANWRREVERLTGEKVTECRGGKPDILMLQALQEGTPYALISMDTLGIKKERGEPDEFGRQETFFPWVSIFKATGFDFVCVDEAHKIKNPEANRSQAVRELSDVPHVVVATASPVLNRTAELWPLLYMIAPDMFQSYSRFVGTYTVNGKRPRRVEELHELLRPRFIRRTKAEVQKDLPPINRIVQYHDLSPGAERGYKEVLAGIYTMLQEYDPYGRGGRQQKVMNILSQILRLKQVCAADKLDHVCELGESLIEAHEGDGKVLIFSQFKGTAHAISERLGGSAVCTVKSRGDRFESMTGEQRDELFESTRHDPAVRFLVTTEAASEGHNLEFCEWVIFNDLFWGPKSHHQCEGRAYGRLSDPHPIDSYYVIADIDIERWLMELLNEKMSIIDEAVEGIESSREGDDSVAVQLIKKMKTEMWRN